MASPSDESELQNGGGEAATEPKVETKVDGDPVQTAIQSSDADNTPSAEQSSEQEVQEHAPSAEQSDEPEVQKYTPSAEQSAEPEVQKDEGNKTFTMRELLSELKEGEGNTAAGEGETRDASNYYGYALGFCSISSEKILISDLQPNLARKID